MLNVALMLTIINKWSNSNDYTKKYIF